MLLAEEVFRISVDRYDRMVESGLLGGDDSIELLSGVIVWKMPKNPKHSAVVRRCRRIIESLIPAGWHVRKDRVAGVVPVADLFTGLP